MVGLVTGRANPSSYRWLLLATVFVAQCVVAPAFAGLGQWTNVTAPGPTITFAVDPTESSTVYGVAVSGEVSKSVDGGVTWTQTAVLTGVQALVVDGALPSRLYAVTNVGLYSSNDAGESWTSVNDGLPAPCTALALDPLTAGTIYCAVWGFGVYKSSSAGASWTLTGTVGLDDLRIIALAVDPVTTTTLYVGAATGSSGTRDVFFKSTDGGATWTPMGLQADAGSALVVAQVVVDPAAPSTIYALTGYPLFSFGSWISKSTDGGVTFTRLGPATAPTWTIALDPLTTTRLYAGTDDGVFTSADGAQTWTRTSVGIAAVLHPRVLSLAIEPTAPSTVYAAVSGEGVYRTMDAGAHWIAASAGLPRGANATSVVLDPLESTRVYAVHYGRGLLASGDAGATWAARNLGLLRADPAAVAIDASMPSTLYVAALGGGVFKSVDRGTTWSASNAGMPSPPYIAVVAVARTSPSIVYAGGEGLFRSDDGGASWTDASAGVTGVAFSIAIDPTTASTLYAGTSTAVYKSVDAGNSWAATLLTLPSGPTVSLAQVNVLVVDPSAPLTVYAASSFSLHDTNGSSNVRDLSKSTDGGASWTSITSGLGSSAVTALVVDPRTPSTLYAATASTGLFRSLDAGATWAPFAVDAVVENARSLALDPQRPSWLYAASDQGLYRIEGACAGDADCNDGNPCTIDMCNPDGSCAVTAVANGVTRDDEDACTSASDCLDGVCVATAAPTACDDGVECTDDACSPVDGTCRTAPRPDHVPCNDGSACTAADQCIAGACDGSPVQCEACSGCDPNVGCVVMPSATCAVPRARRAHFTIKAKTPTDHSVGWSWRSDVPVPFADFGDPLASTDYTLCVYDSSAAVPSLVLAAPIDRSDCTAPGCWQRSGTTFLYRHPPVTTGAVTRVRLKATRSAAGIVRVKAKGVPLAGDGLPLSLDPSVVVQLRRNDAPMCWGATYTGAQANTADRFESNIE